MYYCFMMLIFDAKSREENWPELSYFSDDCQCSGRISSFSVSACVFWMDSMCPKSLRLVRNEKSFSLK